MPALASPDPGGNATPRTDPDRADEPATALAGDLEDAAGVADVFDTVKAAVEEVRGTSRTGIMVGLVDLGVAPGRYLGGYYQVGGNLVVVNRSVLRHVRVVEPDLEESYLFSVLLHEYLHTLGILDERRVREAALEVSREALGEGHPATRMAAAMAGAGEAPGDLELFREIAFSPVPWRPDEAPRMEIVKGLDRDATPYIH